MIDARTHLMFIGTATEALAKYQALFPDFQIEDIRHNPPEDEETPPTISRALVTFAGHKLIVIDSPDVHDFTFTPAMSLFVTCDTAEEQAQIFNALAVGGKVMMPLDDYGFSKAFGWVQDCFGVSWQLNLGDV